MATTIIGIPNPPWSESQKDEKVDMGVWDWLRKNFEKVLSRKIFIPGCSKIALIFDIFTQKFICSTFSKVDFLFLEYILIRRIELSKNQRTVRTKKFGALSDSDRGDSDWTLLFAFLFRVNGNLHVKRIWSF